MAQRIRHVEDRVCHLSKVSWAIHQRRCSAKPIGYPNSTKRRTRKPVLELCDISYAGLPQPIRSPSPLACRLMAGGTRTLLKG